MLAKRLNTSIQNYALHYLGVTLDRQTDALAIRQLSIKDKTHLLLNSKNDKNNILFIYEAEHYMYYWNLFSNENFKV